VAWLAWLAAPDPLPVTTTPVADLLRWAELDGLITLGALLASITQIIAVFRTLGAVTKGRAHQAELLRRQDLAFARQEQIMRHLGIAPADDDGPTADSRLGP
jgi:hypothetical protein